MKLKTIIDTGIVAYDRNGSRNQKIQIQVNDLLFKIDIHSESYEFQSYARLEILNDEKNWTVLTSNNPKKDFGIDISYQNSYNQNAFKSIINSFESYIKKLVPILEKQNEKEIEKKMQEMDSTIKELKEMVEKLQENLQNKKPISEMLFK